MAHDATRRLLDYIDASPTPFHAVAEASRLLEGAGFQALREEDAWELAPGERRYLTRNGSTLVAFVVGLGAPSAGFRLVGAHTDSPNLRLKPKAAYVKEGYRQLGVEVYGGVLLGTWLDRDLSIAGRVFLEGEAAPRLLKVARPLCRIPNVAIHLNREVNEKGLILNRQTQLPPVVGLEPGEGPEQEGWFEAFLGRELGFDPKAQKVLSLELMLHDVAPATVAGIDGELINAPRLDNLGSCHAAIEALTQAGDPGERTRVIALHDHEEVGSGSAEGADSPFLGAALERIVSARGGQRDDVFRALARSLFVSADMAHAVHPNYPDLHEPRHMPRLGRGPVLKVNTNQRYATNGATAAAFSRYAREVDVPLQVFVNRSDLACGTTIGPITASRLGLPTVDVGNPMLSMHSAREMAGAKDQELLVRVLARHLRD